MDRGADGERLSRLVAVCQRVLSEWDHDGIQAAFLYGSVLGESWRADSDIDIALLDSSERRLNWREEAQVMDAFERATGLAVDLRLLRDCTLSHQAHILTEGLLLWKRDDEAVKNDKRSVLRDYAENRVRAANQWRSLLDRLAERAGVR